MNQSQEKILQYLTGYDNIDTVATADLQRIAGDTPYFPVAQFLLTKKLKSDNSDYFSSQVQRTALYFSNPFWLDYQLRTQPFPDIVFDEVETVQPVPEKRQVEGESTNQNGQSTSELQHPVTTIFSLEELSAASELAHETLQETEPGRFEETEFLPTETSNFLQREQGITETTSENQGHYIGGQVVNDQSEQLNAPKFQPVEEVTAVAEEMAGVTRDTDGTTEEFLEEVVPADEPVIRDNIEEVFPGPGTPLEVETSEIGEEMAGVTHTADAATEAFVTEAIEASPETNPISTEKDETRKPGEAPIAAEEIEQKEVNEPDEHERMFQNIKAMLDATGEEADADVKNATIPIDPYYTIDYFASQGIKLELEQNPKDQLGQNLKKFTQWLKHMKKLGPEDATEVISRTETEADIQQIADSSNTVREVVTEAMALVLEKQGKKEKAIELYNKLSFLNPDKSAYFAHKIKNLKGL